MTQRQTNSDAIMVCGQKPKSGNSINPWSLSSPDVNSTSIDNKWVLEGEDRPGSGSHSRLFQGWLLSILLRSGALSDSAPIYINDYMSDVCY